MTNLSRLNTLLATQKLPVFRKTVSPSMNNLKWLRSTLLDKPEVPQELKTLLVMDPKTLLREESA